MESPSMAPTAADYAADAAHSVGRTVAKLEKRVKVLEGDISELLKRIERLEDRADG